MNSICLRVSVLLGVMMIMASCLFTGSFGCSTSTSDGSAGSGGSGGGSGSGGTGGSAAVNVQSITQLPDISTLVTTSSGSSSLAAAVTGTPPLLKDLSESNIDSYFWEGLIATINATTASAITDEQRNAFWEGEGSCRMAQAVGYSFQSIMQGMTSACYMQNMPGAANGVTVVSGLENVSEIFNQGSSEKVVLVQVSDFPMPEGEAQGDEDIFIKVYGTDTSSQYAADLWFCSGGSANSYETIRLSSSDVITLTSVHRESAENTFVDVVTGSLMEQDGELVFDPDETRTANVYFGGTGMTFLGSVEISSDQMTARNYQNGSFGEGPSSVMKHAIFAQYSGDSMDALRFLAAGFASENNFSGTYQVVTGASEYQTDHYEPVSTGTLLGSAQAEDFSESLYTGDASTYTSLINAISNFSCTTTPDITVAIDFSQSGPIAIAEQCENEFREMNFCDGGSVASARQKIMDSFQFMDSCSTSRCTDDFSCQLFADNYPESGLTTANARCVEGCCQAVQ